MHTTYLGGLLGPVLVTGTGLGLLFVPLSLVALSRVRDEDSGLASSLLNTGQQVGGAIGLAALGTVAWTTVANSTRHQVAQRRLRPGLYGPVTLSPPLSWRPSTASALAVGISRGLLAASAIALAGSCRCCGKSSGCDGTTLAPTSRRTAIRSRTVPNPRWSRSRRECPVHRLNVTAIGRRTLYEDHYR